MSYALVDVELTEPLQPVRLRADQDGLGLIGRAGGWPVHFSLHALEPGTVLEVERLQALLRGHARADVVAHALAGELVAAGTAAPRPPAAPVAVSPPPSVTVAVCTRARTPLLAACLASIQHALEVARAAGLPGPVEVLVVDNAPPDDATRELAAGLSQVRYAVEPRPGLDFARNHALARSSTDFVAFVDDDVELDPLWLRGLAAALAEHPEAGAVTGLVLPFELETTAQILFERRGGFRRGFVQRRYAGQRLAGNPLYPLGAGIFGAGCNMVLRREAVLAMGGFDHALDTGAPLPGGGDLDIFYRVVRAGLPLVYEPRMAVRHKHRREYRALRRQYWTWGTGFMAFLAKTYRWDRPGRPKARRMVAWWLADQLRQLHRSLAPGSAVPAALVLAELAGGLVGLAGGYRRSQRRIAVIEATAAGQQHSGTGSAGDPAVPA